VASGSCGSRGQAKAWALGYPDWPADLRRELDSFDRGLTDNQRRARLLGGEIDAAIDDPRWMA